MSFLTWNEVYPVEPNEIDISVPLFETFGDSNVETIAAGIIRLFQQQGNWNPIPIGKLYTGHISDSNLRSIRDSFIDHLKGNYPANEAHPLIRCGYVSTLHMLFGQLAVTGEFVTKCRFPSKRRGY